MKRRKLKYFGLFYLYLLLPLSYVLKKRRSVIYYPIFGIWTISSHWIISNSYAYVVIYLPQKGTYSNHKRGAIVYYSVMGRPEPQMS